MSKISILLSSYNHEEYIAESIESILRQTFNDFELVIVDDHSDDNSWEVIKKYNDPRIKAKRLEKNTNCAYVWPTLMSLESEYIAVAHCDDKWREDKLEKQINYLEEHSEVAACFTGVSVIDEDGNEIKEKDIYVEAFNKGYKNRYELLNGLLYEGCCLCHPSILIRKEAYTKYNLYTPGLSSIPDYSKWIRLCAQTDVYVLDEKLTYFRSRKNGMNTSGDRPEKHNRNNTEMFFVLKDFLLLNNSKDFVKAFPYAMQFLINGEMVIPFAFARILLDTMKGSVYHLFALQLLHELFQDNKNVQLLEELYGYTSKDYNVEKQKYDIFAVNSPNHFLNCRTYLDFGNGFNEEDSMFIPNIYVNVYDEFTFEINLEKIVNGRKINRIRLDLDCGVYRKYSNISLKCKNDECKINTITPHVIEDGWQLFCTPFPQYIYEADEKTNIYECSGKTELFSNWELFSLINGDKATDEMLYDTFLWYRRLSDSFSLKKILKKIYNKLWKRDAAAV